MVEKRLIGYEEGCHPIYQLFCPECKEWTEEYGVVEKEINRVWHPLCIPCGDKAFPNKDE